MFVRTKVVHYFYHLGVVCRYFIAILLLFVFFFFLWAQAQCPTKTHFAGLEPRPILFVSASPTISPILTYLAGLQTAPNLS